MRYVHVDAAKELRLWLVQIVIPAIMILSPDAREAVAQTVNGAANTIKRILK